MAIEYAAAVDITVFYSVIDLIGAITASLWEFLDNSFLITVSGTTLSLLDWFLIGGLILDIAFDVYDELMP